MARFRREWPLERSAFVGGIKREKLMEDGHIIEIQVTDIPIAGSIVDLTDKLKLLITDEHEVDLDILRLVLD